MNDNNKQVVLFFAITVLSLAVVTEVGLNYIVSKANDKIYNIQKDIDKERTLAKKEEEKKAAEKIEKEKVLSKQENSDKNVVANDNINKDNDTAKDSESLQDILGTNSSKEDKTLDDCITKNGKLYFKGVCIPIPTGFKYLMKKDGFMAYADSSYKNIFMVYVDEHYMDNARDGLDEFTYGIGTASVVKSGPKNMKFGKNVYQRYVLEAEGLTTYAFITASKNRVAYLHVVSIDGSVAWAKNSLANLTYYN